MNVLTVATRVGALAIAQTNIVIDALKRIYPDVQIKITKITTTGDKDRRTALWNLKTTGFFTSQVEDALLAGEADFAVHSFKDLPTAEREGLAIAAVCDRQYPQDCLLSALPVKSIEQLPAKAKVGTSSLRRAAQIKKLRADLEISPIRGNVQTRLRKLNNKKFDAIILARAGLERLALSDKISFVFEPAEFIPAPAQGALAIQTRTADAATNQIISAIDDRKARITTFAERRILTAMQCGCHAPVGAFARIADDDIKITAFISDLDGRKFITRTAAGSFIKAESLAEKLANELLSSGGNEILDELKS